MDYYITGYDIDCPQNAQRAVLEDSIMHKNRQVTAGSKIMENFISPLDATVVTRLEAAGICILGKTKMDEFGISELLLNSGLLMNSEFGIRNPEFCSGAVSAVADGIASFALCNDFTGAIGREAAAHGVCYVHPTYGTVSRYGLIPAVPSMDQIGVICKTPADGSRALSVIAGHDPKDGAMFSELKAECGELNANGGRLKIGIPVNAVTNPADMSIITEFIKNFETVDFELKYLDVYAQVMQILCCAELSSNITRYDGIKFGYRAEGYKSLRELYTKSRTEALGEGAKLVSIIGSMVLSQESYIRCYDKAMRIRRLIKESLEFDKYDAIIIPAFTKFGIRNSEFGIDCECKTEDDGERSNIVSPRKAEEPSHCFPCFLPMLCGLPAVTVPFNGGGFTLIADVKCENVLFSALEAVGI